MAKKSSNRRLWLIVPILAVCLSLAAILDWRSVHSASYIGLQTVPCLNSTEPLAQDFKFNLSIMAQGQAWSLAPSIGHDFGNCLHDIHTDDASGQVVVQSNDFNPLSLGQFFDVWKMTFNDGQIGDQEVSAGHSLKVISHGQVYTKNLRAIELQPGVDISVIYQ